MNTFDLYKDIETRTGGEIYIGVVGPVRTGKSTFIKRFMDVLVLPNMEDEHAKMQARDELPQSASGKTIMTTEPKFVPKEGAKITVADDIHVKVRQPTAALVNFQEKTISLLRRKLFRNYRALENHLLCWLILRSLIVRRQKGRHRRYMILMVL